MSSIEITVSSFPQNPAGRSFKIKGVSPQLQRSSTFLNAEDAEINGSNFASRICKLKGVQSVSLVPGTQDQIDVLMGAPSDWQETVDRGRTTTREAWAKKYILTQIKNGESLIEETNNYPDVERAQVIEEMNGRLQKNLPQSFIDHIGSKATILGIAKGKLTLEFGGTCKTCQSGQYADQFAITSVLRREFPGSFYSVEFVLDV